MQIIALAFLGALTILVASTSPLVCSDLGRLLLVAAVSSTVLWLPTPDSMPFDCQFVDRLIAAFIGGGALYYLIGMALGPVQFRIVSPPPRALIEMRRGAYRMQCAVELA
jgi:hypothetical protein